jgi:hypothetical protein
VAVRVLALAFVVAEVVSGGKTSLHGDFKHGCLLDSMRGSAPDSILVLFATGLKIGSLTRFFAAPVHLFEEVA